MELTGRPKQSLAPDAEVAGFDFPARSQYREAPPLWILSNGTLFFEPNFAFFVRSQLTERATSCPVSTAVGKYSARFLPG
jgi:hypothetical protein